MNLSLLNHVVSPLTHNSLKLLTRNGDDNFQDDIISDGLLQDKNTNDTFPVIEGVPMLQPPGYIAGWYEESLEVLFGMQTASIVYGIYEKIKEPDEFTAEMKQYIKEHLGADGVRKAFKDYSALSGEEKLKWFYCLHNDRGSSKCASISPRVLETGRKNGTLENGKLRVEQWEDKIHKWAVHVPEYISKAIENEPPVIVELATGGGLGTFGLIKSLPQTSRLISIDIDFSAVKNAEGLSKYYGIEDRVDPVTANFWFLPFKGGSIDTVCSHYGLDESREVPRVISEVSRILSPNGKFINVSRKRPEIRMLKYLDGLGLTNEELDELACMAGLYAGVDETISICKQNGLVLEEQINISPEGSHERVISVFRKA